MKILAICNKHQSVGKTELTGAIAHGLIAHDKSVAVVCADDDNQFKRMRAYCTEDYPRGFECYNIESLPENIGSHDYVLLDTGRGLADDGIEFINQHAHYVIFPVGRDSKTFDEGVKPIQAQLNGCKKAFVINEHIPREDWNDELIAATANGAGIHVLYTWPDSQAGARVVKKGLSAKYAHDVPGIDRYRNEVKNLAQRVIEWSL